MNSQTPGGTEWVWHRESLRSVPWLDETLTEFSSQRYLGTNLNCNVTNPFGNTKYALDDSMATYDPLGNKYFTIIYFQGPCVIEKLRRDFRDTRFDQMMQDHVAKFRLGVATTPDFEAEVRAFAPAGYDVNGYFTYGRESREGSRGATT